MIVPESCAMLRTSSGREFGKCCLNQLSITIHVQKADRLETVAVSACGRKREDTRAVIKTEIWPSLSLSFGIQQNQFAFLIPDSISPFPIQGGLSSSQGDEQLSMSSSAQYLAADWLMGYV